MTDYNDIVRIKQLDQLCDSLGFRYDRDHLDYSSGRVALYATDKLVVYNKESPLASGNVDDLLKFLYGWEKAHQYLHVLGATTPKSIERKCLDYRNKKLANMIKHGKKGEKSEA